MGYANTTGGSEEECVRKCIERTDFCAAVIHLRERGVCLFSFKWISCNKGEKAKPLTFSGGSRSADDRILHCIRCTGNSDGLIAVFGPFNTTLPNPRT